MLTIQADAQVGSVSPYSRYGLGDLRFDGFAAQIGMGGVGAAYADSTTVNFYNPASLGGIAYTVFDAAGRAEIINLSNSMTSNWRNNSSFAYLSLAFPIAKGKWGAGFGLVPFSEKGYDLEDQVPLPGLGDVSFFFDGSGGLSRFYIGNGFTIGKNLSIGLNASYIFGSLNRSARVEFPDLTNVWNTRYNQSTSLGDFYFDYGIQYKMKLTKKNELVLGFTGVLKPEVNAVFDSYTYNYEKRGDVEIVKDTVQKTQDVNGSVTLPERWALGFSYRIGNNWQIIGDYSWQDWSKYRSFSDIDSLKNSYRFSAGAMY
ncbi:MAG: hypothetical protein HKN22_04915, partial [Bacteroidia bacterium]|nr:hypothetical protein [Bacteroidia bacterium]